jgi:SAM-dependent methyltransferase
MSSCEIAAAYEGGADAWLTGPDPAYRRFAAALVAEAPSPIAGARVLDVGAGTGAVTSILMAEGAQVVAADNSPDMLRVAQSVVPGLETVLADAMELPFRDDRFDGATGGFCVNHMAEPDRFFAECGRVVRPGGFVLASTFAAGEDHPAKACVEEAAREMGWEPPSWEEDFRLWSSLTDTEDGLRRMAELGGLERIEVRRILVDTGLSTASDLVRWRLGMAQISGWVSNLGAADRQELITAAEEALGPQSQPLRRSVLILSSTVPA